MCANSPTWAKTCHCGATIERWPGQGDVTCYRCNAEYNAGGQKLSPGWQGNPSWQYDDIDDMSGYEAMMAEREDY